MSAATQIVLVGMRSQEAAAMEVLVGKTLSGWTCLNLASLADLAHAQPGICVVDLPGLGMHRTSEAAATALQQALANRTAIVLYRSQEAGWTDPKDDDVAVPYQRWVTKPVSASAMRDALEWAVKSGVPKPADKPAPGPIATPPAPPAAPVQLPVTPAVVPPPLVAEPTPPLSPVAAEPEEHNELTVAEFAQRLAQLEAGRPSLFLRKLAEALESSGSFEIRLTLQNCLLVCPQEHWIASNTPMAVVHRLAASDALAAVAQIYPIEGDAGRLLARHANMAIQPLDTFLWLLLNPSTPGHAV